MFKISRNELRRGRDKSGPYENHHVSKQYSGKVSQKYVIFAPSRNAFRYTMEILSTQL